MKTDPLDSLNAVSAKATVAGASLTGWGYIMSNEFAGFLGVVIAAIGLLLNAYAFGTMAKIMTYAAIAAFLGSALMALLALLGLRHAKKVADAEGTRGVDGTRDTVITRGATAANPEPGPAV